MASKPKLREGEKIIIEGVRYKSGSVKIIEQDNLFYVEYKRRFFLYIVLEHKIYTFPTLLEAQTKYDGLKSHLWIISRS